MNQSEKKCAVVRDLLPLYAEQMVQPQTAEVVKEHLSTCADCRKKYDELTRDPLPTPAQTKERMRQTKPLRKYRFRFAMNVLGAPLWLPLLLAAIAVAIGMWLTVFSVLITVWCLPISSFAFALVCVPVTVEFAIIGETGGAILAAGLFLAAAGMTVLLVIMCAKLTALFFRGSWWLVKKIFVRRKKSGSNAY